MNAAVDTLKIYGRLRAAKLEDDAAKEIAEVLNDVLVGNLATKTDLENVRAELKTDIEKTRAELKTDIEKAKSSTIKWVAGMLVALVGIFTALLKLL